LQSRVEYQFSASRSLKREQEDLRAIYEDLYFLMSNIPDAAKERT